MQKTKMSKDLFNHVESHIFYLLIDLIDRYDKNLSKHQLGNIEIRLGSRHSINFMKSIITVIEKVLLLLLVSEQEIRNGSTITSIVIYFFSSFLRNA